MYASITQPASLSPPPQRNRRGLIAGNCSCCPRKPLTDGRTSDLQMIRDASKRPMWDNMCDYGSVVKTYSPNSDLIYLSYQVRAHSGRTFSPLRCQGLGFLKRCWFSLLQGKLGVCARDLSLLRAWKEFEDGTYMLVAHSIVDNDVPKVISSLELRGATP